MASTVPRPRWRLFSWPADPSPSDRTASEVSRYLCDHINAVAYEAGVFVGRVRIGDGVDQGTGWHKWSVSVTGGPRPAGLFVRAKAGVHRPGVHRGQ